MERAAKLEINGLLLVVALIIVAAGLTHEQQLHAPLPPQAYLVEDDLVPGAARQTWFRVPTPVEEVRRFYQRALSARGWHSCGTQATPACTNGALPEAHPQITLSRSPFTCQVGPINERGRR